MMNIKMKERKILFVIFSAFLSLSDSHLYNHRLDNYLPVMSKMSESPDALETLLNYFDKADKNLDEDSNYLLDRYTMLRGQNNLNNVMDTFLNKVKYLKGEVMNKVVHEAMDVVDVNKDVLADMIKIFKDITRKVKNGAQIVDIVEVTSDIVQYTNMTLSNLYNNDIGHQKKADQVYKKIKKEILEGDKILRQNVDEKEDLRKYLNDIRRQMYFLESDLKVIVKKAKEIRKAMVEIIDLKPMLEEKFKNTKVK